ncbi:MAG: hypothetical protein LBT20_01355 [Clostridiales bacterium]|jgi:hypothetical protein|nr:hypothetical protein [Clostridiales bacterium]
MNHKNMFYDTNELSLCEKAEMLRDCKEISYEWQANKLDCSESFSRQHINWYFDETLKRLNEEARIVVIDRGKWSDFNNREHFEVGFRSIESPVDYFWFIEVESEKMPPILKKYKLKPQY